MSLMSIVKLVDLEEPKKLDAEIYRPEFISAYERLKKFPEHNLGEFIEVVTCGNTYELYNKPEPNSVRFITTQNVRDFFLDEEKMDYTPLEKHNNELKRSQLREGDLVLTHIGADFNVVGRFAIIFKEILPCNISQSVALIRLKGINPFYVMTFFNTKFGRLIFHRKFGGTNQKFVNYETIKKVPIIVPDIQFQTKIQKMILESYRNLKESKSCYNEAYQLFDNALKINGDAKKTLCYTAELSEIVSSKRLDAEFYRPELKDIINQIPKGIILEQLQNMTEEIIKGIEVGAEEYLDEGIPFVRVSNLTEFGIDDANQKFISDKLYQTFKSDFKPEVGEILISKDATLGVPLLVREDNEMLVSGGILRLKLKPKINKNYMVLALNSDFVKMQIVRDAGGSIIIHWRPELVKNTLIPILPIEKQEKISKLMEESYKLREESRRLLQKAKTEVESLIV